MAVINFDDGELGSAASLGKDDFLFVGDAAEILPELLKPVIGDLKDVQKEKEVAG